jgi:hypothetical protein
VVLTRLKVSFGLAELGDAVLDAAEERGGVGWDGGGDSGALGPQAGEAHRLIRRHGGPGSVFGEAGRGSAGVDGPADPPFS